MKKILLTAVMLMLAVSVTFAYVADDINDIFTAPYMRARSNVLDVYFGTQNLKFAVSLDDPFLIYQNWQLKLVPGSTSFEGTGNLTIKPTIGIGYDFGAARVALAYDFGLISDWANPKDIKAMSHKVALGLMFPKVLGGLNVRVSAGFGGLLVSDTAYDNLKGLSALSIHPYIELNTGFAPFNRIRLYINYGTASSKNDATWNPATFGGEIRLRTKITPVTAFALQPELRVIYKAGLNEKTKTDEIKGALSTSSGNENSIMTSVAEKAFQTYTITKPSLLGVTLPVFFNASNDYVSVELIPMLAFYSLNGTSVVKTVGGAVRNNAITMFGYSMEMNIDFLINKNLLTRLNLGIAGANNLDTIVNSSGNGANKASFGVSASCGLKWTF